MPLNRPVQRRLITAVLLISTALTSLSAQETAKRYFESVSERYAEITDYTANLTITRRDSSGGDTVQIAAVMFKTPNLLRLDFEEPAEMVMVVGPDLLQVWVNEHKVTFSQALRRDVQEEVPNLNTPQGLALMSRYYTVAYVDSPDPVPLDAGSSEMVVRLKLDWKSNNEGYRQLLLALDNDKLIRRIIGITTNNQTVVFDFTDMELNTGIPDARFDYESPPEGNTIENFLFDPES